MPRLLLDTVCFLEIARGGTRAEAWFQTRLKEDYDGAFVSAVSLSQLEFSFAATPAASTGPLGQRVRRLTTSFATSGLVVPYDYAHHERFTHIASSPLKVVDKNGAVVDMPLMDRMVAAVALAGVDARPFVLATPVLNPAHAFLRAAGLIIEQAV